MAEPTVRPSGHRMRWGWWPAGAAVVAIVAALIGYQTFQPFSGWVNDLLGSLNIGE